MVRRVCLVILGTFIALGAAGCSPALPGRSATNIPTATPTWSPPTPTPPTFAALNPAQAAGFLGPSDLFPALHALQPHVAYPLRAADLRAAARHHRTRCRAHCHAAGPKQRSLRHVTGQLCLLQPHEHPATSRYSTGTPARLRANHTAPRGDNPRGKDR